MREAIAVLQMNSSANRAENLQCAEALIVTAVEQGAKVLVMPENFALLGVESVYQAGIDEANNSHDSLRQWLALKARQYSVWLVAGSIPMASCPDGTQLDRRVRAACFVFNENGDEVARYDKIHLFDVDVVDNYGSYRESDTVEPGDQLVVVDTPCGRIGLTLCYDLRFAEQFYQLREQGAEIITVPSAFTAATGAAHWEVLLRARAIETQCYVVAPNQTGEHSVTRRSYGNSMIIDPWGEVLVRLKDGAGVASAEVDLQRLTAVRERMPVQQHHRLTFK
jgi:predicted amidohydrolase